jgi:hypothetical protein
VLKLLAVFVTALAAAAPLSFTWVSVISKQIEPGMTFTQMRQMNPPLLVDIVSVDHSANPALQVSARVANDSLSNNTGNIRLGRETVTSLCARTGAVAAVNADYFPGTGDPLGFGVTDGEIYSEPYVAPNAVGRAAFGVTKSGRAIVGIPFLSAKLVTNSGFTLPITGIDRLTSTSDPSDCVICAPIFGSTSGARGGGTEIVVTSDRGTPLSVGKSIAVTVMSAVGNAPLPASIPSNGFVISLPVGSPLADLVLANVQHNTHARIVIGVTDQTPPPLHGPNGSWGDVVNAVGGGPILLQDGNVVVDTQSEGIPGDIATGPHARTGVGVCKDGKILIVTVDAGSSLSGGITLQDFASLMQSFGVTDAINLDGGGSTTMALNGQTVDFPSGSSFERQVADMLTVFDRKSLANTPVSPTTDSAILPLPDNLNVGGTFALTISSGGQTIAGSDPSIVWNGPVGSIGFISQDGILHILNSGQAKITAEYRGQVISESLVVGGSTLPTIAPALTPNPSPTPTPLPPAEMDETTDSMNRN